MSNVLSPVKYLQNTVRYLQDSYIVWRCQKGDETKNEEAIRIATKRALSGVLKNRDNDSIDEARVFASDRLISRVVQLSLKRERSEIQRGLDLYERLSGSTHYDLYKQRKGEVQQLTDLLETLKDGGLKAYLKAQKEYKLDHK